jgi:hypothetical protein
MIRPKGLEIRFPSLDRSGDFLLRQFLDIAARKDAPEK